MRAIVGLVDDDLVLVVNNAFRNALMRGDEHVRIADILRAYIAWIGKSCIVLRIS